ncbi:DUF1587 domain-containing protein [Sorangium sp. So ce296]|uniref:DUF1587 domain-containing protein n=1 Tax=Sorangium sp. So ce296 TaxID=3133296 RepID=UPI003F5FB9B8
MTSRRDRATMSLRRAASGCLVGLSCAGLVGCGGDPERAPAVSGGMPLHRMTAAEYNTTVAHLLGTSLRPADGFPASGAKGFDVNGLGVASFGDDLRGEPNRLLEEILR